MLVVEDGTGLLNSEAYCSVAFADQYHSDRNNFSWAGTDQYKEAALRRSADFMQQAYRGRWMGTRTTPTQALDWPRIGVYVEDLLGFYVREVFAYGMPSNVLYNVVPKEVMQANALLALRTITLNDDGSSVDLSPDIARATKMEKVGSLEVQYVDGAPQNLQYVAINRLLQPYLSGGPNSAAIVRR